MTDRKSSETISQSLICDIAEAPSVALLLDLDGTLLPLAPTPPTSIDPSCRDLLADLSRLPGFQLVVMSGRTRSSLASLFPTEDIWLIAEHGAWRRGREGVFVTSLEGDPTALRKCSAALEQIAHRYPGAWVEPKSFSVCFHHRLVADDLQQQLQGELDAAILGSLVSSPDHERVNGAATVEVRHRGAHKGTSVDWVLGQMGGCTRLVVLGDDATDEDAFRAAGADDLTFRVGDVEDGTSARFRLEDSDDVRGFLRALMNERLRLRARFASVPPGCGVDGAHAPGLVVISNRLPPPPATHSDRKQSVGGLVSALEPALEQRGGGLWLGWSGLSRKLPLDADPLRIDASHRPVRAALDLAPHLVERYYDGFCNRTLWPLLHGFCSNVRYDDAEWRAYVEVNRAFADAAFRVASSDELLWVHDYHLLLVARELRAKGHRGPVGFFLHVPLPQVELLETLPWASEILDAMMDFDVVGFHTERYVQNYLDAQSRLGGAQASDGVLRKGARTSQVAAFPIGISPDAFAPDEHAEDDEISNLIHTLGERRLILGVDRLDYSKGIPERLRAFKRFLESFPEWRRKVALIQVSVPSRESLPEYAEQRRIVEGLVGHINGEFGEVDWVPVRYLYRSYGQAQLARLYRAAAVGLVTPLRDGMNLVAKEFIASQHTDQPGVLLLSRFAGAADELAEAVLTNPFHADGLARDLDGVLRMPLDERRDRHAKLLARVRAQTAHVWADSFLATLERASAFVPVVAACPGNEAA